MYTKDFENIEQIVKMYNSIYGEYTIDYKLDIQNYIYKKGTTEEEYINSRIWLTGQGRDIGISLMLYSVNLKTETIEESMQVFNKFMLKFNNFKFEVSNRESYSKE